MLNFSTIVNNKINYKVNWKLIGKRIDLPQDIF